MSRSLDIEVEQAFHRGLTSFGSDFLIKVKEICLSKYDFEDYERSALIKTINHMRTYAEQSKANLDGLRLANAFDFGLSKFPLIVHIMGDEVITMMNRAPSLRTNNGRRNIDEELENRRESLAYTVSTSMSVDDDIDDYGDETFEEEEDVASESQEIARAKVYDNRSKDTATSYDRRISLANYDQEVEEEYPISAKLQRSITGDTEIEEELEKDVNTLYVHPEAASPMQEDEEELIFIPSSKANAIKTEYDSKKVESTSSDRPISVSSTSKRPTISTTRSNSQPISSSSLFSRKSSSVTIISPPMISDDPAIMSSQGRSSSASQPSRASKSSQSRRSRSENWIRERKWILADKIGHGSFGEVFQGMNKENGQLFACKALPVLGKQSEVEKLAEEIELMRGLSHPNIVAYLGTLVDEEKGMVYIFQEWVPGGSVAHLLKKFGPFHEDVVRNYTRQILYGLQYLHDNNIVHRDIKGGNILVDDAGIVKLADFGASRKFDLDGTQATTTIRGTPYFMAVEVLSENRYGRKGDIWATGCTIIQMLTGNPPWKDFNLQNLVQLHMLLSTWNKGPPPCHTSTPLSPECEECLNLCFQKNEAMRPFATELLNCAFLAENLDESYDDQSDTRSRSSSNPYHETNSSQATTHDMDQIRHQLGRAVSRASISIANDDIIAKIDHDLYDKQRASNPPSQQSSKSTPPRQHQQPRTSFQQLNLQAPSHYEMSPDGVPAPIETTSPGTDVRAQRMSSGKNPYAKGATRISRDIVAKAGASSSSSGGGVAMKSSPTHDIHVHVDDRPSSSSALIAPKVDTKLKPHAHPGLITHDHPIPSRSIITSPSNGNEKEYRQQRLQALNQAHGNKHPMPVSSSENQSSARDTEALTPLSDDEDDDHKMHIPSSSSASNIQRREAKPRLKSPITYQSTSAPISRRESSASAISTISADAKPMIASSVYASKRSSRSPTSELPQTSSRSKSASYDTLEADDKHDMHTWLCLKCNRENLSSDYEKYCSYCATVRGSTGQRGSLVPLNRHH